MSKKTGVWLIGARGSLATTLIAGARAIAKDLTPPTGLLTEKPELSGLASGPLAELQFGGYEIRHGSLRESAMDIYQQNSSLRYEWIEQLGPELDEIDQQIKPGLALGGGQTIERMAQPEACLGPQTGQQFVDQFQSDLKAFRERHHLDHVVVVNLASTEPPTSMKGPYQDLAELQALLPNAKPGELRPGLLYAHAAFLAGCAYLNFTPSNSALCPANEELAKQKKLPYMGNDGKTGETLVKSALAPMFKYRNLEVSSWIGYNLLGNRDGEVLDDADNKRSKVESKDSVLTSILGYPLKTHVGIDYVPALQDNKVAWDFIHFRGFLNHGMVMQFIWQGCDSILAAPVVLDLIRFIEDALNHGQHGPLIHLASFFKSPIHCSEHDLHQQFHFLTDFLRQRARDSA